jgi:serine/threonine-protein kinase
MSSRALAVSSLFCVLAASALVSLPAAEPRAAAQDGAAGTTWVLAIGIDEYKDAPIPKLACARKDAQALAAFFATDPKSPTSGERVLGLYDRAATRSNVLARIQRHLVQNAVEERDTAILYVAAHGFSDARSDYYVACHDTELSNLLGTAISQRDLEAVWGRVKAGRKLLLVDACHSGGFGGVRGIGGIKLAPDAAATAPGAGSWSMLATSASQLSVEDKAAGHGVFTLALLDGLRGAASQAGAVTAEGLAAYLRRAVPKLATRQGGEQEPVCLGAGSFPLTRAEAGKAGRAAVEEGLPEVAPAAGKEAAVVLVKSRPSGARVIVDAQRDAGRTPVPVELAPGPHKLLLALDGRDDKEVTVEVAAGERKTVDIELTGPVPAQGSGPPTVPPVPAPGGLAKETEGGWSGEKLPKGLRRGSAKPVLVWDTGKGLELEFVYVPAGDFLYGYDKTKTAMDHGCWIGRTDVTWKQYRAFCAATGHASPVAPRWGITEDHPVVNVSWDDLRGENGFLRWAGVSLPSETEWEKAARGEDGRKYPWGNEEPTHELCTFDQNYSTGSGTSPVTACSKGASPYGALDMAGNVWQWCEDAGQGGGRVVRGGSWDCPAHHCRSFDRLANAQPNRRDGLGFRGVLRSSP